MLEPQGTQRFGAEGSRQTHKTLCAGCHEDTQCNGPRDESVMNLCANFTSSPSLPAHVLRGVREASVQFNAKLPVKTKIL